MKFADVSPMAGMLTGEGLMGKLISQGVGGVLPAAIARNAQRDAAEEEKKVGGMKKGGSVSSASKRADGCCIRGKTRGKMM